MLYGSITNKETCGVDCQLYHINTESQTKNYQNLKDIETLKIVFRS